MRLYSLTIDQTSYFRKIAKFIVHRVEIIAADSLKIKNKDDVFIYIFLFFV